MDARVSLLEERWAAMERRLASLTQPRAHGIKTAHQNVPVLEEHRIVIERLSAAAAELGMKRCAQFQFFDFVSSNQRPYSNLTDCDS